MEFWNQHGLTFLIGMFLWPRMILIYYSLIPAQDIGAIMEFLFVPRIFLASILTPIYWGANPTLISIYWVLAVILDIISIFFKIGIQKNMWEQFQTMQRRGSFF